MGRFTPNNDKKSRTEPKRFTLPNIISREAQFNTTEDMEGISKYASKKETTVYHPTSSRFATVGSEGHYTDKDAYISNKDTTEGTAKTVPVASTAVQYARFNPKTNRCYVFFVGGKKEYEYEMTPEEFNEFMSSTSKGAYVNRVMKHNNRAPGY